MTKKDQRPPIPKEFLEVFRQLVRRFQPTRAVEPETAGDYYTVLNTFSLDVLRRSANDLALHGRFLPTTGEWAGVARLVVADDQRALLNTPAATTIACDHCQDTGSVYATCPGDTTCGRSRPHAPHGFVCVCACRSTNHNYQRSQAAVIKRYAEES